MRVSGEPSPQRESRARCRDRTGRPNYSDCSCGKKAQNPAALVDRRPPRFFSRIARFHPSSSSSSTTCPPRVLRCLLIPQSRTPNHMIPPLRLSTTQEEIVDEKGRR
ncbi:hypothetical protein B296_00026922 [Ensete ventricosum]|uniref:Uncharacterized protein n=1 Tax=Ensete ventricosum TaxID=4639 RepID=A0A426ZES1_ENSVE|nr:hypothetical protein B296_00026922 [Ensete ventricosum]